MSNEEIELKSLRDYERILNVDPKNFEAVAAAQGVEVNGRGVWDQENPALVDAATLKSLFFTDAWVYIIVDLVAMKISSQMLKVYRQSFEDGQLVAKPVDNHAFGKIIENPNPLQSYHAWCYSLVVDLILTGNSQQWFSAVANSLIGLPSESVQIEFNETTGVPQNYMVADNLSGGRATGVKFPATDVVHFKRPNPSSLYFGLSPFTPGSKSVLFNRYSQDYLNGFYQKGAVPGFAIVMDKDANERVAMRLLRSFEQAYTGRRNQRRTIILPKGTDLKEVSHSLADQQLSIYIDKNREDIAALLKVPKHELSLQAAGSLGSEEYKIALKNFWHATLIPTMRIVETDLTTFARRKGLLSDDEYLEFDLAQVEALQDDEVGKSTIADGLLKTHTINEVRKKLYNLGPIDGGDVILALNAAAAGPSFFSAEPERVRELPPTNTGDDSLKTEASRPGRVSKDQMNLFLKGNDDWFEKRQKLIRESMSKTAGKMERVALDLFSDMAVKVIKITRSHLKEKKWDEYISKGPGDKKPEIVRPAELRRRLMKAIDSLEEQFVNDATGVLMEMVDVGYNATLAVPFNLPSPTAMQEIKEREKMIRQETVEEREGRAFRYLKESKVSEVFGVIERGIDSNRTVQEIAKDLRDKFTDIKQIGSRALTIARTETGTATMIGQAAAMKNVAEVEPKLKKMWIATISDDKTRDSHADLHGSVVDWDEPFDNDLQFPLDPTGSPDEVINCRCTFVAVNDDEAQKLQGDSDLMDSNNTEEID